MTDKERAALLKRADEERKNAYAPYSGITVGAALLTDGGEIYTGANVENAAYSPSVCAERVAIFKAVTEGKRNFRAIAVSGGRCGERYTAGFSPCGVCRQVMQEFSGEELEIILFSEEGAPEVHRLEGLLPLGFDKKLM